MEINEFNALPIADLWQFRSVAVKTSTGILLGKVVRIPFGFKGRHTEIKLENGRYKTFYAYAINLNVRQLPP